MSTNKVYGDLPNAIPLRNSKRVGTMRTRLPRRIPETFSIDQSKRSLFGTSELAGEMVQRLRRRFHGRILQKPKLGPGPQPGRR